MSIASTQSTYAPQQVPAERRPYGDANTAPSTFDRQDVGAGHSLATRPAQGMHAGRTVTVEPDRDPVSYSAQVEEYKRKIEMFLCKKFGKSKEKAAAIVSFLPTKDLKIELPAATISREQHGRELECKYKHNILGFEDRGEKYIGIQVPQRTITRRVEDVYKHIYDVLMTVNQYDYSLESMKEMLHFDGCQAANAKTERLQIRASVLLALAWVDISDEAVFKARTSSYPCILFPDDCMLSMRVTVKTDSPFEPNKYAPGVLRNKYSADPFAREEYQGARKEYFALLDGSIRGSGAEYAVLAAQKIHAASNSKDNVPDLDNLYPAYAMEEHIFNKLKEIL